MEKGPGIIYQQFFLAGDELEKELGHVVVPSSSERWGMVKHGLQTQGFSLMCAQSEIGGVPINVIVGIPADCMLYLPVKERFYELTTKYCLPFNSGEWFMEEFPAKAHKNLLSSENYRTFIKLKSDEYWFNKHHGQWVGFVGGELVAEADDEETILNQLQTKFPGQEGFYSQVLTEEEEDERAIQIP